MVVLIVSIPQATSHYRFLTSSSFIMLAFPSYCSLAPRFPTLLCILPPKPFYPEDIYAFLCTSERLELFLPISPSSGYANDTVLQFCSAGALPCAKKPWIVAFFPLFRTQRGDLQWTGRKLGFLNPTKLHKCYFAVWLLCGCVRWAFHWGLTWVDFDNHYYQKKCFLPCSDCVVNKKSLYKWERYDDM